MRPCADNSDREPVESVLKRILEPEHARSIGVSQPKETKESKESKESKEPRANGTMALVPLNIIYLPPPDWHQPLKPLGHKDNARLISKTAGSEKNTAGSATSNESGAGADTEKQHQKQKQQQQKLNLDSHATGDSILVHLASWVRELAGSAKKAAMEHRNHSIDNSFIKGTAIEKAVESGRQTILQIRALPKTDDWVTWLGKALNQMTGYTRIAELKTSVEESGNEFKIARKELDELKQQYTDTVQQRITNQREINGLLQRKHLWNESDVARFTDLYKDEYQAEGVEQEASKRLKEAEGAVDLKYDMLVSSIRERYHEEQIWSDKIRRASTYGTWAVLFMNILALFLAQAIFEPRKRRKIIDGVDERLGQAMLEQQEKIDVVAQGMVARQESQERDIGAVAQHLSNVAAVLETVVSRQDILGSSLSARYQADLEPRIDLGEGCSDSELDLYYEQQQQRQGSSQHGFTPAVPGSMIWKAVKPAEKSKNADKSQDNDKSDRTFTRAEAGQLAIETAAVAGCLAAMITFYFSS
ncbi:sensitivity to high expression protein she9 [Coemansia sp. IMI 203386]|nr:sensitivity to high expression protein she9 [Coemansia sp. IMI 203386]